MRVCALASGSSGNSFYIEEGNSAVLVDAGLSAKQLIERMREKKIDSSNLKGIFITHEHIDHIRGADVLARQLDIPLFATQKTISNSSLSLSKSNLKEISSKGSFSLGKLKITAFPKSHSASDPVSFLIQSRLNKKSVGVITDLGYVCENVSEAVSKSDFLFLESNHDIKMLEQGPYLAWHKKWILSNEGHLSNTQAALCILEHAKQDLGGIVLSHLSSVNNTPQVALKTFRNVLKERDSFSPMLKVSLKTEPTEFFEI